MAKVGLENDTLKQPKCPSNWEYSTGQRQLLDIQSGEQMDRLSFSAPKARKGRDVFSTFFFSAFWDMGLLVKIVHKIRAVFVLDFEAYLKVNYHLQANSAEKLMRIFKRITTMCFKSGLMAKDPFCDVRLKKVKKDRGSLTRHELELILNYKPTKKRLEKARDVFVFCCFTGFDYSTTASLTEQNLVLADDGSMWIETHRVKTGVASKVKLLDIPLSILKKYEPTRINGYLLPVLSNAKYNLYLKEIAATLGIQKRVTSHLARHTFATTVTYANGVSIESISKMLGHTKLATTQIYARIVDQTVSREMDKLSAALSGTSFSLNVETSTHETTN